jgi:HD-GYP domain-containing protein (c-di-GMP phosphodiesterase class II)
MAHKLVKYLEDNSLTVLREATADVRANAGPTLQNVSEDDLQVAMYTVLLKIIDNLREKTEGADAAASNNSGPRDVKAFYLDHVKDIMTFVDSQSSYTVGHTPAVVRHVVQIASLMGMTDEQIDDLEYAAWIHNIGLLNQSQSLDTLPRVLSSDEIKAARNHTVVGAEMIRPLSFIAHLVPVVRYHHNYFDGSAGGPQGEGLPLGARIIALADAYQAMLEPRAYRPALSRKDALMEIVKGSGIQFDPQIVPLAHDLS